MPDRAVPVLVVFPYREEDGPRRVLEHVVEGLHRGGYRVVCVLPPEADASPALERRCAAVERLPGLRTFPRTLDPSRLGPFLRRHLESAETLERLGRRHGARAVYSVSEAVFAGALAARRLGVPSVLHVIGMSIRSPRILAHLYVRALSGLTTRFVACSSAVAEMLASSGADDERITVIHNGVSIAEIDGVAGAVERGPGERSVGMVAAFDPRKGHELFVEAAALVARAHPDARFVCVGGTLAGRRDSAAFRCRVDELVERHGLEGRFTTTGHLAPADVVRRLRSLDAVVVPSRTEGFAHALLDAMACGRPVVASALEGNLDAFVHEHSGLYADRSATAFAEAVSRLLADPALASRLGAEARARAEAYFDLPVTLPLIARTLDDVIGRRAPVSAPAPGRAVRASPQGVAASYAATRPSTIAARDSASIRSLAAAPSRSRSSASARSRSIAERSAATSPASTRTAPVSASPPTRLATTGRPYAIASRATAPYPSRRDGTHTTAARS